MSSNRRNIIIIEAPTSSAAHATTAFLVSTEIADTPIVNANYRVFGQALTTGFESSMLLLLNSEILTRTK